MQFSADAEETFSRAINFLLVTADTASIIVSPSIISSTSSLCIFFLQFNSMKQSNGQLKEGENVTLVQSGIRSIWRQESTHQIQVRKVQG